jgi:glutamate-1-semialdehyde 2,1-aminomutase
MGLRAVTIGYGYERIAKAAYEQIRNGNNLTRPSKIEVEAAEALVQLIDGAEMVKFAKNGSTVTTAAVKLARAYTGRKYIARCAEHPFFSYDDWFVGNTVMTKGIPEDISRLTLSFHFNDILSLAELFTKYPGQIAGVILEPATAVEPVNGFLSQVGDLCRKEGAVFILDEMISGFRWHLKGAQFYYGVIPDLSTFGKGMANGFSVAALVGKREIMNLGGIDTPGAERVFLVSTTHGAEMSSLGAFIETIKVYQELDVVRHLWSYGTALKNQMNTLAANCNLADYFVVEGTPVTPNYICKDANKKVSAAFRTLFMQEMIRQGVLIPWVALSYSHGETELEGSLEACKHAFQIYAHALDDGIDKYLIGPEVKPVFRKWN